MADTVRLTLDTDATIDLALRLRAAREGVSPSEVVDAILRKALAAEIGEAAGQPPMADVIQDVVNANQRAGKG
jgi:plasmid stability protein